MAPRSGSMTSRSRQLVVLSLVLLVLEVAMNGSASAADRADLCDRLWEETVSRRNSAGKEGVERLLAEWKSLDKKCRGTGIYEARLASLYLTLGDSKKARETLRGVKAPSRYEALATTIKLRAELAEKEQGRSQLEAIETEAAQVVTRHPDYIPLLSMLGTLRVKLDKYDAAIGPLEAATRHPDGNRWTTHRNLTIAYSYSGQYRPALAAGDKAYAGNKELTSDEEFMYALALAYAATDDISAAKDALELILNKKPQLNEDPKFQQTVLRARELSGGKLK